MMREKVDPSTLDVVPKQKTFCYAAPCGLQTASSTAAEERRVFVASGVLLGTAATFARSSHLADSNLVGAREGESWTEIRLKHH
jgi:hypothetical protein